MQMGQLPTLTFKSTAYVCTHTSVYVYGPSERACVCDVQRGWIWRSDRIIYTPTHTACDFLCPGYNLNMEETAQKALWHKDKVIGVDRCACASVHSSVSALCQDSRWLVKEHKWPSPHPSLSPHPFVHLLHCPNSSVPVLSTMACRRTSHERMRRWTHAPRRACVCGLFMTSCELVLWHVFE